MRGRPETASHGTGQFPKQPLSNYGRVFRSIYLNAHYQSFSTGKSGPSPSVQ